MTAQIAKTPINPAKKELQNGTRELSSARLQELKHFLADPKHPAQTAVPLRGTVTSHVRSCKERDVINNVYPHLPGRRCQMPQGLSVWKGPEVFTMQCCFRSATAAQALCLLIRRPFS